MMDMACLASSRKIVLVGNPNCGKTTLFNALTGSTQRVGNWSGVTVEKKAGYLKGSHHAMMIVDLPGTYSLLQVEQDSALDEKLTSDCIHEGHFDLVLNVVDAANLERNLYLTTQLLEQGLPVVVALNRMDLLEKKGIQIDTKQLSAQLGCPVFPISAACQDGLQELITSMDGIIESKPLKLPYPPLVEKACESMLKKLSREQMVRFLEGESVTHANPEIHGELLAWIQRIGESMMFESDIIIAQARYQWIENVLSFTVHYTQTSQDQTDSRKAQWSHWLDRWVLHRFWGFPIFLAVMYSLFFFAINIGGAFQDFFELSSNVVFVDLLWMSCQKLGLSETATVVLTTGVGKGMNTVFAFVPVIGSMFLALSFLEDSGYMARAAFVVDRIMRALGLPGKSFVPLIVGFGCNVPAIMGARTLEHRRDRVLTVMISPFMSCGARLAIFTLFVAAFFPSQGSLIVFSLYMIGILMAILTGLLLKKTILQGDPEPMVLELPTYQWPRKANLFYHTWHRLKKFLVNASKLIVPVCLVVGTLNSITVDFRLKENSSSPTLLAVVGKTLTPIFSPMGIEKENWPATVGLVTGVMAKEVVIGTLNSLYTQESGLAEDARTNEGIAEAFIEAFSTIPKNLLDLFGQLKTPIEGVEEASDWHERIYGEMQSRFNGTVGAFAYLIFVLLYFPCISATAAMVKEVDRRWTLFSVLWTTFTAYVCSVAFYQLATLKLHPLQSISWLLSIVTTIGVIFVILKQYRPQKQLPTPIVLSGS